MAITGRTTPAFMESTVTTMQNRHNPRTGEYEIPLPPQDHTCVVCDQNKTDTSCTSRGCNTRAHHRCLQTSQHWKCTACTTPTKTTVAPLTTRQLRELTKRAAQQTIYSASDGSVRGAGTAAPSSTFGVFIDLITETISRCGRITIRTGEESSLRTELEGLIHAYNLIPSHIQTRHTVDNMTALDIHERLAASGLPPNRQHVQHHYHSTITRLHLAMQRRGAFLATCHTLSHLEHKISRDTDLNARRAALAGADKAADEAHDLLSAIRDDKGIEAFPLRIKDVLVEKSAASPFTEIQRQTRLKQLYSRSMEGANARAGSIPNWSSGSKVWATHLRNFRHKLWTKRLPTAYNRSRRGDTEDGVAIMPWCPECLKNNMANLETHEHLIHTCPFRNASHYKLARTLNNNFRLDAAPTLISPLMQASDVTELLQLAQLQWNSTPGWESHTTDKHGRTSTIRTGPPGTNVGGTHFLTSWLHSVLRHCDNTLPLSQHTEYITNIQPEDSLDPHLLQGLASVISATTIHDTIPHNPFIPTTTLSNKDMPNSPGPIVFNATLTTPNWSDLAEELTPSKKWILLADEEDLDHITSNFPHATLHTIPKDQIKIWGRSFWAGTAGLYHETSQQKIHVVISPDVSLHQHKNILDTIYMRSESEGELSDSPDIDRLPLLSETPPTLARLLTDTTKSTAKTQLLSGGISEHIIKDWGDTLPHILIQKIYRKSHLILISHQLQMWQQRNTIAHPPTEPQNKPNYGRKRKPDQIIETESDDSDNGTWGKQRDRSLRALAAWRTGTASIKAPLESLSALNYTTPQTGGDGEGDSEGESKEAISSEGTTEAECSSGSSQDSHSSPAHNIARRATRLHTTTSQNTQTNNGHSQTTNNSSDTYHPQMHHLRPRKRRRSNYPEQLQHRGGASPPPSRRSRVENHHAEHISTSHERCTRHRNHDPPPATGGGVRSPVSEQ